MEEKLIELAEKARKNSYSPYSSYSVGAALLCDDGEIFTGCNVENAAYSVCSCAERTALFYAVAQGKREFKSIAVVGGKTEEPIKPGEYAFPCGVCRQALYEFSPDMEVIAAASPNDYVKYSLKDLLKKGFGPSNLD